MALIKKNESKSAAYSQLLKEKLQRGIKSSNADFFAHNSGAHPDGDSARFLFWHSDIETAGSVELQLFIPSEYLLYDKPEQHINVTYYSFPADLQGPFASIIIDHIPAGNRDRFGALYQLQIISENGEQQIIRDPMAWSMPFGIHAPAELYNIEEVLSSRKDSEYFKQIEGTFGDDDIRVQPSVNLLEIHTSTTTKTGTLQALSNRFRQIGAAIQNGQELSPDEQNLIGFDAIELMPIDPVVEHPGNHHFWSPIQNGYSQGENVTVKLKKPTVTNWGYDITIFGAAAVNPSILSTGRPHELLGLIETLHNFPGQPIKVVLDVVYGHADNQAEEILTDEFFAGSNIYGKSINFKHPMVRASILELHRRKMNWGFDGIRVDSAQDIKVYDRVNEQMICNDKFLNDLSEITPEVSGVKYKPWMIFEDGRPWPRDDWELASTYREITKMQGHPSQWAPTIFAYNTPYNYTYWVSKWWRILEVLDFGEKWITGYANHDTMRRGSQKDPSLINVNHQLGNSLKMVMDNAYNNPSTTLLMNCFLPGVPMDFAHALGSTPWSFIRNTDTDSAIKIVAEEAHFAEWQITDIEYRNSKFFRRIKDFGFRSLDALQQFTKSLKKIVRITECKPDVIVRLLNASDPPFEVADWTRDKLDQFAAVWMEDLHDYCNVDLHAEYLDPKKAKFNLQTREFRIQNPWLNHNFTGRDLLNYRKPVEGAVLYYGYRMDPVSKKELVLISHMEGQPRQITPSQLDDLPIISADGWNIALSTPSIHPKSIDQPIRLAITQGVLFERQG